MTKLHVSIVIVTYNGHNSGDIQDCLASLSQQSFVGQLDIIVVDNHSTDQTVRYIKGQYPQVQVLSQDKNLGFAGGNNVGFRLALKNGSDAVILLNQDTIASQTFVAEMVKAAYSETRIGIVQGLILLYPEKNLVNSSGNSLHYLGFGYTNNYREEKAQVLAKLKSALPAITYPSGAAMLIKKEVLLKVGLFDEEFFMYHEDTDLGWRARLEGWQIVLAPQAEVWHKYSFSRSINKYYYLERNRFLIIGKHYGWRFILLILPMLFFTEIGLDFFALKKGFFKERFKAWAYFFNPSNITRLLVKRRDSQRRRQIADNKLLAFFSAEIYWPEVDTWLLAKVANPVWKVYWLIIRRFI